MSDATARYALPFPEGSDPVGSLDEIVAQLAERVDLMLGETGTTSITPGSVNATTSKRINYARSYAALSEPPQVLVGWGEGVHPGENAFIWSTGEDATGFTLNIRSSNTAARTVKWAAL